MQEFIEVDILTHASHDAEIADEVMLSNRYGNEEVVVVLTQVNRCGTQSKIMASTISSMAVNYIKTGEDPTSTARLIFNIFGDEIAAFSLVSIRDNGVSIAEFNSPGYIFLREGVVTELPFTTEGIICKNGVTYDLKSTRFVPKFQDRIVVISKGITLSGISNDHQSDCWQREGVAQALENALAERPEMSAHRLVMAVVNKAEMNDNFIAQNDMSCGSVYFRKPRKLLICTGPPKDEANDYKIGEKIRNCHDSIIIAGGTTATIAARELGREISVNLKPDISGLPPTGAMQGVNLITEGVITLAKVKSILEQAGSTEIVGKGTDFMMVRMLLSHDVIYFCVGTKVNEKHQDPTLPIELELRRNVVKEIARLLRTKFLKEVNIEYI